MLARSAAIVLRLVPCIALSAGVRCVRDSVEWRTLGVRL